MMASLVRPIAAMKLGCGGHSGAAPKPSTIRSSGKPSSCALWSATSSARATTCVEPARLWVGAKMIVNCGGASPQSWATFSTIGDGGAVALSSTSVALSAWSTYASFSNSGSRRASARAGPEPKAKNELLPALCDSFQAAYWLVRHAITGLDVRVETAHGQFGIVATGVRAT